MKIAKIIAFVLSNDIFVLAQELPVDGSTNTFI
jgi:hypothetical protein